MGKRKLYIISSILILLLFNSCEYLVIYGLYAYTIIYEAQRTLDITKINLTETGIKVNIQSNNYNLSYGHNEYNIKMRFKDDRFPFYENIIYNIIEYSDNHMILIISGENMKIYTNVLIELTIYTDQRKKSYVSADIFIFDSVLEDVSSNEYPLTMFNDFELYILDTKRSFR